MYLEFKNCLPTSLIKHNTEELTLILYYLLLPKYPLCKLLKLAIFVKEKTGSKCGGKHF